MSGTRTDEPIFMEYVVSDDKHLNTNSLNGPAIEHRYVNPSNIWIDYASIPAVPAVTAGVVALQSDVALTLLSGTTSQYTSATLSNVIMLEAYRPTLKDSTGAIIPYNPAVWVVDGIRKVVDFKYGIPDGFTAPFTITFWQYIGATGSDGTNVFESTGGVTRANTSHTDYSINNDFVYGSSTLDLTATENARFLFDKSKGAFRCGYTSSLAWDDSVRGTYSFACGYDCSASGSNAVSGGNGCISSGTSSVALGDTSSASSDYTVALGQNCEATATNAVAFGFTSTATDIYSVSIGKNCDAEAESAVSIGRSCDSTGIASVSIGDTCISSGLNSCAIGNSCTAAATESIVIGNSSSCASDSNNSLTLGSLATNNASHALFANYLGTAIANTPVDDNTVIFACEKIRIYTDINKNGAELTNLTNTWATISNKDVKENEVELDYDDILDKLNNVPIYKYNFIGRDPKNVALGPMAQDWNSTFKNNGNPLMISMNDKDAVALACIRALSQKNKDLEDRLAKLEVSLV